MPTTLIPSATSTRSGRRCASLRPGRGICCRCFWSIRSGSCSARWERSTPFAGRSTATESPGVYRLVAPTGAGKTRSALAFGLRHAVEHHLERVIFAVPYLSITDQVAHVARSIFGAENVLEHHSGILTREPSFESKLAVQNWSAALIVTTTVQLLESLLSNRPSRCRKLHNIANSVIVLDEVQSLPVRLLRPIVSVLN